jgi:azurin
MRQLEPHWREALADASTGNAAGFEYMIRSVGTPDLMKLPQSPPVLRAILARGDVTDADRHKALGALAKSAGAERAVTLLDTLDGTRDAAGKGNVIRILPQMARSELKALRTRIAALTGGESPVTVRQYAWAALAQGDESFDGVWKEAAGRGDPVLLDLVSGVPLVFDTMVRAEAYDKVMPLLAEPVSDAERGRIRQAAIRAAASATGKGATTFAALATLIERGEDVPAAARAMRSLPAKALDRQRCAGVAGGLVKWARGVSADKRTSADYQSTVQLAEVLVTMLPAERAASVVRELKDLRVSVFVVRSVPEQMRYDTPRIVVEAGKPFELTFENPDLMPHNLVILKPGSRERVGVAAMKMRPEEADPMGRQYVPNDPGVIAATKMLESGGKHTIKMTAPNAEGDYEYVCTYPDHWRVMWGRLVVTKDIDGYLLANPDTAEKATGAGDKGAGHVHGGVGH